MNKETLLAKLLGDFIKADMRRQLNFVLSEKLDLLPVAGLAARLFPNDKAAYEAWLQGRHVNLGTLTPLEILASHGDTEHWTIRKELNKLILKKQGLLVEFPCFVSGYKAVTTKEGSTAWRLLNSAPPVSRA